MTRQRKRHSGGAAMDDFIIRAAVAAVVLAGVAGVLGCFVVWRRMAYFSDSLAHSALLGLALGVSLGISLTLATGLVCLLFALAVLWAQQKQVLTTDATLGILAHATLAGGIIAVSLSPAASIDLHSFLLGDILTIGQNDLLAALGGAAAVGLILHRHWQPLLLMTINADLAAAEGISALRLRVVLVLLMTVTVAVSIHLIGVLLIASLLIIPAAAARLLARSPEAMALAAALIGVAAAAAGLGLSLLLDVPASAAIVSCAALLFAASAMLAALQRR